jgi:hypothetical protein
MAYILDLADRNQRDMATSRIASAKADLLTMHRNMDAALDKARAYQDPDEGLNANGLQARREELAAAVRASVAPALAQLRAQVTAAAETLATQAAAGLPKEGDDPASIMRTQRAWDQARMQLDAGMSMRDIIERADAPTSFAIREWAPAYLDTQRHQAKASNGLMMPTPAPDHGPLMRTIDTRLAELTGPDTVAALAASHNAIGVAAYVEPGAKYLDSVITGGHSGQTALGSALESDFAEQEARAGLGLPEHVPTDDAAPAAEGAVA